MTDPTINQREQQILKMLVERYILDGTPIGSKTLAEESALGLSPATIRSILADLEDGGYLTSPHTSAGRIPTTSGYRFFVNSLLEAKPLESVEVVALKNKLDPDLAMPSLLHSASSLLSSLTQLTGVVALPRRNRMELRQVEFLGLSANRVLVILILNDREVQNRVIYTDRVYSKSELQQAANYLNVHYAGKNLLTIRAELMKSIRDDRDSVAQLLQAAVDVGNKAFDAMDERKDYIMAGQNNLLNCTQNEVDLERIRILFDAFTEKQEILSLLDHALEAEGIQIFIGRESGYEALDDCSIVTASYSVDGRLVGSLGVIGLTRMPYERVISAVDITAKLLSAALNQG
ncbi:MAG: HrcA family transcriptional regulator [Gammaproteobacteria bacterium]|jgi:heat-inducible transcriptional repressor|nr:HrcA family transcriptional regulator [Gammaproteobacteria bacterium]